MLDILMFLLLFVYAIGRQWTITNILWGLWLASLVFGYVFLLIPFINIVSGAERWLFFNFKKKYVNTLLENLLNVGLVLVIIAFMGLSAVSVGFILLIVVSWVLRMDTAQRKKWGVNFLPAADHFIARLIVPLPSVFVILIVFSLIFLLIHYFEGLFINMVLQTGQIQLDLLNPGAIGLDLWHMAREAFPLGWMVLFVSAFSRLDYYFSAISTRGVALLYRPYRFIVRMQITILIFLIVYFLGLRGYALYPVLLVFFIPFETLYKSFV